MSKEKQQEEKVSSPETAKKEDVAEMPELSLPAMLKAGLHFGHKKSYWNPKMDRYIFTTQNNIHIIDLEQSLKALRKVIEYLRELSAKNGTLLIVGTKNQAKDLVRKTAEKTGMPYVNNRWLGGTLTNFGIIKKRIKFFVDNKEALEKGKLASLTKLERNKLGKRLAKIEESMGGLVGMNTLPEAILVLDVNKDKDAVKEAKKMGIKVIGLLDSNSDPDVVDLGIPANDDAVSSLRYILNVVAAALQQEKNPSGNQDAKNSKK